MTVVYKGVPESQNWQHVGDVARVKLDAFGKSIAGESKILDPNEYGSDGFGWSYMGTGPSATALALLVESGVDRDWAEERGRYHQFKNDFIATLPHGPWVIEEAAVLFWAKDNGWEGSKKSPDLGGESGLS